MTGRLAVPGGSILLSDGVRLRPLHADDAQALARAYTRNAEHLRPWDPTRDVSFFTPQGQQDMLDAALDDDDDGRSAHFVLSQAAGGIVGRLNVNNIVRGAFRSADLGYWVDASLTGRGLMTAAVGVIAAHARDELGLHRLQAGTLVHNAASQQVLLANGFERIGRAARYLRIAGEWQDHILFQRILTDD